MFCLQFHAETTLQNFIIGISSCQCVNIQHHIAQLLMMIAIYFNSKSWKLVFKGFPYMGMFD